MDRVSDFRPRGPWFDSPPMHISLWPWASHIYPLLSTGLTQEAVDGRPTWTDCDEARDYVVPNVLSPRDLVSRPDIMDETVPHSFGIVLLFFVDSLFKYSEVSRKFPFRKVMVDELYMKQSVRTFFHVINWMNLTFVN